MSWASSVPRSQRKRRWAKVFAPASSCPVHDAQGNVEVMFNIHTNVAAQQPSQLINLRRDVCNLHRAHSHLNMTSTGTTNTSDAEQMVCGMCREVTTDWTRLTPIVVS